MSKQFLIVFMCLFLCGCGFSQYEFTQYDENNEPVKTWTTPKNTEIRYGITDNTFFLKYLDNWDVKEIQYIHLPTGHTIKSKRIEK